MGEIARHLRDMGAHVDLVVPEAQAWDLAEVAVRPPEYDLYVLKSATPLGLSLAGALTQAGAQVVNSFQPVRFKDKVVTTMLLGAAGVPLPPSWAAARAESLRCLLDGGPLVVKPPVGSMGKGVRCVSAPVEFGGEYGEALRAACVDAQGRTLPVYAQREVPSLADENLKVYVAGEWVGAVSRPYPVTEEGREGRPAKVSPAVRQAALACGRVLQLELYGVDFLVDGDRFWVVDVNSFPSYRGLDEAPGRIADQLLARATTPGHGRGRAPPPRGTGQGGGRR